MFTFGSAGSSFLCGLLLLVQCAGATLVCGLLIAGAFLVVERGAQNWGPLGLCCSAARGILPDLESSLCLLLHGQADSSKTTTEPPRKTPNLCDF